MGAVLLEKILRVQPDVKKIFLLVRAADTAAAEERVFNEVNAYTYTLLAIYILSTFCFFL